LPKRIQLLYAGALIASFSLLAAPLTSADVRVWTDKESVILKGDLKGLEILPSGAPGQSQSAPRAAPSKPALEKPARPDSGAKSAKKKSRKGKKSRNAGSGASRTLRVGKGEELKFPSEAAKVANDGDTIEIKAGVYVDCAIWKANNLTIRGIGGRAHVKNEICGGKGIWNITGNNTTIENIEFSGMINKSKNGSGIRMQGVSLTVRNSYFHDGEQGILGGRKPGNVILIEDTEFARLGKAGRAHPIYINNADSFTLRRSYIHGCVDEGNCLKTRAKHSVVTCNVIASMDSDSSWEVDFPNGGLVEVRNNVIQQGAKSANNNIIGFAKETKKPKKRNSTQKFVFENNIVINDKGKGKFIVVTKRENTEVVIKGNKFIGGGKLAYEEGNERISNRSAAGLKDYPALPAACAK